MNINDRYNSINRETISVIRDANDTIADYPREALIHELFEQQVERTPEAVAVQYEDQQLTYAQLNAKANQLAHGLLENGAGRGQCVAIVAPRGVEMLLAQLATLKAGGTYVPIDPEFPQERRLFMLEDCRAKVVLFDGETAQPTDAGVPGQGGTQWLELGRVLRDVADLATDNPAVPKAECAKAAYVMYTSGSTGQPKGVAVPHRAISRLVMANGFAELTADDVVVHCSNTAFDASTLEVWGALLNGGRILVVSHEQVLDPVQFGRILREGGATVLYLSAGLFNQYADQLSEVFAQLKYLIVGGDVLDANVIRRVLKEGPPRNLLNGYGPTETTTFAATCRLNDLVDKTVTQVPIGKPIGNTQIYILDGQGQLAPVGVTGEIHIGGDGVALGYLNRPELTAERFIPDPFSEEPDARMYRSGDLGYWRADGLIEFVGRNDFQVKIRGFRIELGEIEARLGELPEVKEVVVLAREDHPGDKRLVAYWTPVQGQPKDELSRPEKLRDYLKESLPSYMVPVAFVKMEALPLNTSGKVNRKALPVPDVDALVTHEYEAPQGEIELRVALLWQELLGVNWVGRNDNFFDLGGNSLLMVALLARLRDEGLFTSVEAAYSSGIPTMKDLAAQLVRCPDGEDTRQATGSGIPEACTRILPEMVGLPGFGQAEIDTIVARVPGGASNIKDIYPLSTTQEGILFHHRLDVERDTYVVQEIFRFDSVARFEAFFAALQELVRRHDALRTMFLWENLPEPVQVVQRQAEPVCTRITLDDDQNAAQAFRQWLMFRFKRLDLGQAPLVGVVLGEVAGHQACYGALTLHHIITDHVSVEVMLAEIRALMQGEGQSRQELAERVDSYRWFVEHSRDPGERAGAETFFKGMLADYDEPSLPFGLQDVRGDGTAIVRRISPVEETLGRQARRVARSLRVSPAIVFHLVFGLVVSRFSGRDDVVFGTVMSGRMAPVPGIDRTLGMFINVLPLRLNMTGMTVREALLQVERTMAGLIRYEDASLALMQRYSGVEGDAPLFSALLNYRHGSLHDVVQNMDGVAFVEELEATNYPFDLSVDDTGDGFVLVSQTDSSLDPGQVSGYMHQALEHVVSALEHEPYAPIDRLDIMPAQERDCLLHVFNDTEAAYPMDALIHELFEQQVKRTPNAVAIQYEGQSLSYAALNARANQLANRLRSMRDESGRPLVYPDVRVAICVERSFEMVTGLLGILKAGAAYVPVDPEYPLDHVTYILKDAGAALLLTQSHLEHMLPLGNMPRIILDDESIYADQPETNLSRHDTRLTSRNLAYVIYTSGSTGLPKGVMNEHRAVVNRLCWMPPEINMGAGDRILQKTSFAFDVSIWEIFWTFLNGARIVLASPGGQRDPRYMIDLIDREGVTMADFVPSILQLFLEHIRDGKCGSIRHVLCGGEELPSSVLRRAWMKLPGACFYNFYGPTETTVDATYYVCNPGNKEERVPIGKPISNTKIYILDDGRRLAPVGVSGEVYIAGHGVARGYLNREELTAERFVDDPFSDEPGARMYRTGDLGRWRSDGQIEYLGRNDFQVKIRGFRIELGEVEARLAELPEIREVLVLAREDHPGDKRLVAYWTAHEELAEEALPDVERLRDHLKAELPAYMVPSAFMRLEAMPLTPNGKVDRKALPTPDAEALVTHMYEAPQGPVEEVLAGIWQELLGVERVGRNDSFFDLGGHSLLAVQLMGRMRRDLGQEIQLRELFDAPTLAAVASRLQQADEALTAPIELADRTKDLVLSWAQQRLWFLEQLEDLGSAYHIPAVLRLQGELDRDALQRSLDAILARHEALRTVFVRAEDGEPVQRVLPVQSFALAYHDLSQLAEAEKEQTRQALTEETLHRPFDLTQDILIRASLVKLDERDHVLNLCMHHIVSDGWSMGVLTRELGALYEAFSQGQENPLAALPIQYADYAQWQRQWLSGERLEQQVVFWRQELTGAPSLLELPTDRPRPQVQSFAGSMVPFELDEQITAGLNALARRHGATLFMVLQAGFAVLLGRLSGQDDVVVGTPVANRRRSELEGLIGFFVNTLALRTRLDPQATVAELLAQVKDRTLAGFGHQDVPFEQVVEAVQPERSMSHSPLFQVMLALQNNAEVELKLPGLTLGQEEFGHDTTHFDLTLSLGEAEGKLQGALEYSTVLFERTTVERWLGHLKVLLSAMVVDDERTLAELPLLTEPEREQLINEFNATKAEYPRQALIHELFEQQVGRTPEAVAVRYGQEQLTYAQLNAKANQLAHRLRAMRDAAGAPIIKPDALVAISVERSLEMVVGLLGILKAGAAYVPVDPEYPEDRIAYMLRDSQAQVLLTEKRLRERLSVPAYATGAGIEEIVLLDDASTYAERSEGNISREETGQNSTNLAYVIYTSGSTGLPKGVMVEHRQQDNLLPAIHHAYGLTEKDRVLQFVSMAFDVAAQEIFGTLTSGATLVLRNEACIGDSVSFWQACQAWGITVAHLPAAFWHRLAYEVPDELPAALRLIALGGERLDAGALSHWFERQGERVVLLNEYGPTETTVTATVHAVRAQETARAPIGRPLANVRIYVLDGQGQPAPLGVQGEICIGGEGIARGYLNRLELTEERFVKDPFSDEPGARMYRTGDLGYWQADGALQFAGRNDDQVKIRGFRVELGEIEAQLAALAQVREAVVVAREDHPGDKRLVAYWTAHEGAAEETLPDVERLRDHLKAELPAYMVPSAFMRLEAMPLTPNGKVDRKALPAPDAEALVTHMYEAPQGPVEEVLAGIWQELLGVERVGRNDSFFDLGGHSLLIVSMVEKLRQAGLKAEIRQVFQAGHLVALAAEISGQEVDTWEAPANLIPQDCTHITPDMLPLVMLDQGQIDRIAETVPGGMANIQDIYPLAPLQEGVLFYHRFHQDNDPYVTSVIASFGSKERFENFAHALNRVVARHDVLRTAIMWEGLQQAVQVVHRHADLVTEPLEVEERGSILQSTQAYLDDARLHMVLSTPPLLRLRPVRVAGQMQDEDGKVHAVLMLHHVIGDHVSLDVMMQEVVQILEGKEEALPVPMAYRGFVAYSLDSRKEAEAEAFFRQMLGDVDEPTAPFGLTNVHGDGTTIREVEQKLGEVLSQRIKACVHKLGMSAATLFHVAYALVLGRSSSRDDVVFGSVLSGRMGGVAGADRMMGMFINTLPVRLKLQGVSVLEAMRATQDVLVDMLKYEQTPLAVAQRCSGLANGVALFSAVLNFRHSQGSDDKVIRSGMEVVDSRERSNYLFAVSVDDLGDGGFALTAQTDGSVVEPGRILGYLGCAVLGMVEALEADQGRRLLQLEVLPQFELEQLFHEFNATKAEYPRQALIHELFEQQVGRTPEAVAVRYGQEQLTYAQLNAKANQLAHWLLDHGAGRGQCVAIVAPRGIEMLLAQLATLKAGGTYVPIDPEFPKERRLFMLEDSQARVVLFDSATTQESDAAASGQDVQWQDLNLATQAVAGEATNNPAVPRAECAEVAYVMYTSGSTGKPKGVMAPHRGVNRLVFANGYADITPEDVLAHFSNPAFDGSTFETWGALLNGARVVIVPQETVLDPVRFGQLLLDEGVTTMFMTIGLFHQYADALAEPLSRLKYLLTGGDVIEPNTIRRVLKYGAPENFMAAYGPTETTTFATTCRLNDLIDEGSQKIPLGRPIGNTQVYILDGQGQPVPIGVTGEIHIGGDGVALGYLNRPELTAERFIPDPFSGVPDARMYKTGDLGYWRADGLIEFVGRNDFQVKIRGFRIELGEIEARLGELPEVKEVVVLAREDHPGDKGLVAYWTAHEELPGEALPDVEQLRDHLKAELPEYMVPSAFVKLDTIPLTPNGKVDRKALPAPDADALVRHEYEAPQGPVEDMLAGIWQELLGVDRVGRNDNFFDLGGHSLMLTRLASRLSDILDVDVRLNDLFSTPSLDSMGALVERYIMGRIELDDQQ